MEVSIVIPAVVSEKKIDQTTFKLAEYLRGKCASFEIVVVPNPLSHESDCVNPDKVHESFLRLHNLSQSIPEIRIAPHLGFSGKFAAIKTGVIAAKGSYILFMDADMPFQLSCLDDALERLRQGYDLVIGDRRHPESKVSVETPLLMKALLRDWVGRLFNLGVRFCFPSITFGDTQAGFKGMSKRFAKAAFRYQVCPGFYGDIELLLASIGSGTHATHVPVVFEYCSDGSSVNFFKELFRGFRWLFELFLRNSKGMYRISLGESHLTILHGTGEYSNKKKMFRSSESSSRPAISRGVFKRSRSMSSDKSSSQDSSEMIHS